MLQTLPTKPCSPLLLSLYRLPSGVSSNLTAPGTCWKHDYGGHCEPPLRRGRLFLGVFPPNFRLVLFTLTQLRCFIVICFPSLRVLIV